jgi:hypothetical protein
MMNNYWFDPSPYTRSSDAPIMPDNWMNLNKVDFTSAMLHEMGHGLGIVSNRVFWGNGEQFGSLNGTPTVFDAHTFAVASSGQVIDYHNAYSVNTDKLSIYFSGSATTAWLRSQDSPLLSSMKGIPLGSAPSNDVLSSQDFSHVGIVSTGVSVDSDCGNDAYRTGVYNPLANDLMSMCYLPSFEYSHGVKNARLNVTDLDLAILEDIGYHIS